MRITLVFICLSNMVWAKGLNELLQVVNEEIQTLNTRFKRSLEEDPNMIFRASELYFEQAKLLKEVENIAFLKLPPKERMSGDRERFFLKSKDSFIQAQQYALKALKVTLTPDQRAMIYLILGYNAIEFGVIPDARKWFQLARENRSPQDDIFRRASLALGEIAYNDRDFSAAYTYYQPALNFKKYRFWLKDMHNFGWSAFKIEKIDEAINIIKAARSQMKLQPQFYEDKDFELKKALENFYTIANRASEGLAYFKEEGKSGIKHMVNMATLSLEQRKETQAEECLTFAAKITTDIDFLILIEMERLAVRQSFYRLDSHYQSTKKIAQLNQQKKISPDQLNLVVVQSTENAVKLTKGSMRAATEENDKAKSAMLAKKAAGYYRQLSILEPNLAVKHHFFEGESWLAGEHYQAAIMVYLAALRKCFRTTASQCPVELKDQISDSALAVLAFEKLPPAVEKKYRIPVFEVLVKLYPREKRGQEIYPRLFASYTEINNIPKAEFTMKEFQKYFPSELKTLETMVTEFLQVHLKQKNIPELLSWNNRLVAKEFVVSADFLEKFQLAVFGIHLEEAALLQSQKKFDEAVKIYRDIYNYSTAPNSIKIVAGFSLVAIHLDKYDLKIAFDFAKLVVPKFSTTEFTKYYTTFVKLFTEQFKSQQMIPAMELATLLLDFQLQNKVQADSKLTHFLVEQMARIAFSTDNHRYLDSLLSGKFSSMSIEAGKQVKDIVNQWLPSFFYELYKARSHPLKIQLLASWLDSAKASMLTPYQKCELSFSVYQYYQQRGALDSAQKYLTVAQAAADNLKQLPSEYQYHLGLQAISQLESDISKMQQLSYQFPEEKFNIILQQKVKMLDSISDLFSKIITQSHPDITLKALNLQEKNYQYFANELLNFTPPDKPDNYVRSFKSSMNELALPLAEEAKKIGKKKNDFVREKVFLKDTTFLQVTPRTKPYPLKLSKLKFPTVLYYP